MSGDLKLGVACACLLLAIIVIVWFSKRQSKKKKKNAADAMPSGVIDSRVTNLAKERLESAAAQLGKPLSGNDLLATPTAQQPEWNAMGPVAGATNASATEFWSDPAASPTSPTASGTAPQTVSDSVATSPTKLDAEPSVSMAPSDAPVSLETDVENPNGPIAGDAVTSVSTTASPVWHLSDDHDESSAEITLTSKSAPTPATAISNSESLEDPENLSDALPESNPSLPSIPSPSEAESNREATDAESPVDQVLVSSAAAPLPEPGTTSTSELRSDQTLSQPLATTVDRESDLKETPKSENFVEDTAPHPELSTSSTKEVQSISDRADPGDEVQSDGDGDVIRIQLKISEDEISRITVIGAGEGAEEWTQETLEKKKKKISKSKKKKKKKKKKEKLKAAEGWAASRNRGDQ